MIGFLFDDPAIWLDHEIKKAQGQGVTEPHAMSLATVDRNNNPQVRVVLFKGWIRNGLSFFTNYQSPKAQDLAYNPKVSVNFFWPNLAQQILVKGSVDLLTEAENDEYFSTRPRLSQIGAWASDQSQTIANHDELIKKVQIYEEKYKDQNIPRPPHWGGYRLTPDYYEFWFGMNGRLHERYVFTKSDINSTCWEKSIKSP